MRVRLALAFLLLAGLPGFALADIYASPPVFPGTSATVPQGTMVCRVFNAGTTAVTITRRLIYNNLNNLVTLTTNSCGVLAARKYCAYSATVGGSFAYTCLLETSQAGTNLRGVAEFQGIAALPMTQ